MRESQGPLLIVGLGNPGLKYKNTRHNVGFMVLEAYAKEQGVSFALKKQFISQVASVVGCGSKVLLLKPETFMNLSGQSVSKVMSYYRILPKDILIVVDDIYLPVGEIRYREKGSAAGHKGLKSIEQHLGTSEYPRLKIGIGLPEESQDLSEYVLDKISKDEKEKIVEAVNLGVGFFKSACRKNKPRVFKK